MNEKQCPYHSQKFFLEKLNYGREEKPCMMFWISLDAFVILTRHSFGNYCAETYKITRAKFFTG